MGVIKRAVLLAVLLALVLAVLAPAFGVGMYGVATNLYSGAGTITYCIELAGVVVGCDVEQTVTVTGTWAYIGTGQ